MARHDLDPEERDEALSVLQIVECPYCGVEFDVVFTAPDGVSEAQDLIEPPSAIETCPGCGHASTFEFDGWTTFDDAG